MKYINSLVFLSLMILVTGCQKKETMQPKKSLDQASAKAAKEQKGGKKGATMLQTKKSAVQKDSNKKMASKELSDLK